MTRRPSDERLEDVVARGCDGLDIPVLLDVDPGHTAEKLTLPIGAQTTEGRPRRSLECGPRPGTSRSDARRPGGSGAYASAVARAQDEGDVDADADAAALGSLLLAVSRGLEALGHAGMPAASLVRTVEAAIAGLPRPPGR